MASAASINLMYCQGSITIAKPANHPEAADDTPASAPARDKPHQLSPVQIVFWSVVTLGILARLITVSLSADHGYQYDHTSHMGRFQYCWLNGPWNAYKMEAGEPFLVPTSHPQLPDNAYRLMPNPHPINYPPLATYAFAFSGGLWHLLDWTTVPEGVLIQVRRTPQGNQVGQIPLSAELLAQAKVHPKSRPLNTFAARFADGFLAMIVDFLLALGVARLIRTLRGKESPWLETIGYAITILAPPIFLDSAFWIQFDSWVTTLLLWVVIMLMRDRLWLAGVIFGVAVMTKAQAILIAPLLAYVFLARALSPGGSWPRALELWKTGVAALITVLFIAAPFMIVDGTRGDPFLWFKRSYIGTITAEKYQRTTMNAFNLWMVDLASNPEVGVDAGKTIAGITKSVWGKVLLGTGILAAGVLAMRRWRGQAESYIEFSFVVLFCAFMLPTMVHERYIYFCIPYAIALAVHRPIWSPVLIILLIVGTAEMFSFGWVKLNDPGARSQAMLLSILSIVALIYSFVILIRRQPLVAEQT